MQDSEIEILNCPNCAKELAEILVVDTNSTILNKIQAVCPFCSQSSFIKEVVGRVCLGPTKHVRHIDIEFDPDSNFFYVKTLKDNPYYINKEE